MAHWFHRELFELTFRMRIEPLWCGTIYQAKRRTSQIKWLNENTFVMWTVCSVWFEIANLIGICTFFFCTLKSLVEKSIKSMNHMKFLLTKMAYSVLIELNRFCMKNLTNFLWLGHRTKWVSTHMNYKTFCNQLNELLQQTNQQSNPTKLSCHHLANWIWIVCF